VIISRELYQWWAQYLESTGEVESALRYYELGHDWLSLVRLLCYLGNYEGAVKMAEKAEDKASAYHLARTLEDRGELDMAITFYSRAGAYGHAIRMCRENNMPDELWSMSQLAGPLEVAEAAKYFETEAEPPHYDRAIRLYHKGGYDSKALDLAFS
jgi:intraflagellar transport protein 140